MEGGLVSLVRSFESVSGEVILFSRKGFFLGEIWVVDLYRLRDLDSLFILLIVRFLKLGIVLFIVFFS